MSTIPTVAQVNVGDAIPGRTIHIDRPKLVEYAAASLDRNRIHWDEPFAKKMGLPTVIAHGMYTMGAVGTVVADWAGDAGRVVQYSTRFTGMVPVEYDTGADVEVSGEVIAVDLDSKRATVELTVTHNGAKVLGKCQAVVQLD
ncbi:MAG: MaoC/PaaZ C-terminal domain-containing protein [Dermatophilaceae bacterium]